MGFFLTDQTSLVDSRTPAQEVHDKVRASFPKLRGESAWKLVPDNTALADHIISVINRAPPDPTPQGPRRARPAET